MVTAVLFWKTTLTNLQTVGVSPLQSGVNILFVQTVELLKGPLGLMGQIALDVDLASAGTPLLLSY